ncbi:MAG TPA: hypothetical protein VF403_15845, partial [Kofleriaceae bacterium]
CEPAATAHLTPTIIVLVGRGCDSACELVARVLETYTKATVFGGVLQTGRLGHDDPARMVLPHSRLSIYFFATRFVLADEIEKVTGLTDQWAERHVDPDTKPLESFAIRDIEQREHGGWPRCDALPYVRTPELLPEALKAKFPTANEWGGRCDGGWAIEIYANAPMSALQQLVTSCNLEHLQPAYSGEGQFNLYFPGVIPFGVLTQIAASPLVDRVELRCQPRMHLLFAARSRSSRSGMFASSRTPASISCWLNLPISDSISADGGEPVSDSLVALTRTMKRIWLLLSMVVIAGFMTTSIGAIRRSTRAAIFFQVEITPCHASRTGRARS